jgi:hypothetical protein
LPAVECVQALEMNAEPFQRAPLLARISAQKQGAFRIIHGGAPLKVRLRFSAQQGPYAMEPVRHPSQRLRRHRDSTGTRTLRTVAPLEIARRILPWCWREDFGWPAAPLSGWGAPPWRETASR